MVEGFGKIANDCTVDRHFDLVALVSGVLVDDGVRSATLAVDVFGNITSVGMASVAELTIGLPDLVWVGTC